MREILPEIFHWTQIHPKISIPVSSYYLKTESVLFDPLIPDEGLEWFAGDPAQTYLFEPSSSLPALQRILGTIRLRCLVRRTGAPRVHEG